MITKSDDRAAGVWFVYHESYYQLIIKITISEKKRISRYEKGKFALKVLTLFLCWLRPRMWLVDLNYNFECDWLIELSDNKLSDNNLATELVENRSFLTNHNQVKCNFYDYIQ